MRYLFIGAFTLLSHSLFGQENIRTLLSKVGKAPQDTNKVWLYRDISNHYRVVQPDSALYYTQLGLKLAKDLDFKLGKAVLTAQIGSINEKHGQTEQAKQYYQEALALYKQLNYTKGIAASYNGLGIVEGKKGNFRSATAYFIAALRINEKNRNIPGIVQAYIKLGLVNEHTGNLDKSLAYYLKAQELNKGQPQDASAVLYNNTGIIYARKGDFRKAVQCFKQGIAASQKPENADIHTTLLGNAGNAYKNLDDFSTALKYYQEALANARKFRLLEQEGRTLLNIATVYEQTDLDKALESLRSALVVVTRFGDKKLISEVYKSLSDLYKAQKNYKASLEALEGSARYTDSVYNIEKEQGIAALQAGYELEKSNARVQNLELANQSQAAQRYTLIVAIAGILIILVIVVLYLNRTQKLNKQLRSSIMVKDKLFSIIGHDLRSPIANVVQMMEILEEDGFSEAERKELLTRLKAHTVISLETLDTLLHWGKTQLQGVKVQIATVHTKKIITRNMAVLRTAAEKKDITITDHTSDELAIQADPDHFDFVIRNLLSNAIKFSYKGGRVEVRADETVHSGFVTFSVIDHGTGISPQHRKTIFESYSDSRSGTADEKGTGIGLMLSKEFLEANGGRIIVESEEGKGSVFMILFKKAV